MSAVSPRIRWIEIDSTPSTQELALESFTSSDDWLCVRADHQSAGRGRMGRSWQDAPGKNLLLTLAFRPEIPTHKAPLVSLLAGLALWKSVKEKSPLADIFLKWPNDLFVGAPLAHQTHPSYAKVGGILLEAKKNLLLLGLGLNVFEAPHTDQKCACLAQIFPQQESRVSDWGRVFVANFQEELHLFTENKCALAPTQRERLKIALAPLWGRAGNYFPSHLDPQNFIPAQAQDINLDTGALLISRLGSSQIISVQAGEFKFSEF